MHEKHPFGNFIPPSPKYLLLGSFATKPLPGYEWFYANGRNQFWPILQEVYKRKLSTKDSQQKLFVDLSMALADVIAECNRQNNSNLDLNLKNIVINPTLESIILGNNIKTVYFSSRFAEKLFRKFYKQLILKHLDITFITLPSPSPRYAAISFKEKVSIYKKLLPPIA